MLARQRPLTTALRAIGIERSRSVTPFAVSACTAAMVSPMPNTIACTKIPGIRNAR